MLEIDFSKLRILVAGDVMLDEYWVGPTQRISPEAPVPVIRVADEMNRAGGAANVALNASSLGAKVELLGLVGQDASAKDLDTILLQNNIKSSLIQHEKCNTIVKLRILSQNQQLLRLDKEEKFPNCEAVFLAYQQALAQTDVVILSDYDKGTLFPIDKYVQLALEKKKCVLIDPKLPNWDVYRGVNVITPNLKEFYAKVGVCHSEAEITKKAYQLIENYQFGAIVLTRGEDGMTLFSQSEGTHHIPTIAKDVFDVTGAGDTVIATIACAIGSGESLQTAIKWSNAAAGIVVSKVGTASVTKTELEVALHPNIVLDEYRPEQRVVTVQALLAKITKFRENGDKIIFTNGCFDILHKGHAEYLAAAKALGGQLIVAVNVDETVKKLKGSTRPINKLADRMALLSHLTCVDWVLPFSEDTPQKLIEMIQPDILVKGGDYSDPDAIPGAAFVKAQGGEVKLLNHVPGYSTTNILSKSNRFEVAD